VIFSRRIKGSIGMCIETIASNQAFLLSSLLLQKRDSILEGHSGAIHPGLVPFLRAQPLLSGTSIFGEVSELAKDLPEVNQSDRTLRTMKDTVTAMSRTVSVTKTNFSPLRGPTTRCAERPRPGARAREAQCVSLLRPSPLTLQEVFPSTSAQPQSQPGGGRAGGRPMDHPFSYRGVTV
jgi:hypothetical protein